MRAFFLIIGLLVSTSVLKAQSGQNNNDTLYCIQVLSTRNPELLKPEMVSAMPDTAMVEQYGQFYRIMFVYNTYEEADIFLWSWRRQHKNAFLTVRTKQQVERMYPLFTFD